MSSGRSPHGAFRQGRRVTRSHRFVGEAEVAVDGAGAAGAPDVAAVYAHSTDDVDVVCESVVWLVPYEAFVRVAEKDADARVRAGSEEIF